MVRRKFNCRVGEFWLKEVGTSWRCRKCGSVQASGTVAFEILVKRVSSGVGRSFLCLDCASDLLETSLDKVRTVKTFGKDAFCVFDKM